MAVAALAFSAPLSALQPRPAHVVSPQMFFGGGPKGEPVELEIKTFNGLKTAKGTAGAPLMKSMGSAGLIYGCKEGQCGSCEVKLDGRVVRTCVAKLPKKAAVKVDITQNKLLLSRKTSNF